jgi:hypothetical protein
MKLRAKKLLITTEKHEIFIVHPGVVPAIVGYCNQCAEDVEMLTFDAAVKISGLSGYQIAQQIANQTTHSVEAVNGHLLLCRKSLINNLLESSLGI